VKITTAICKEQIGLWLMNPGAADFVPRLFGVHRGMREDTADAILGRADTFFVKASAKREDLEEEFRLIAAAPSLWARKSKAKLKGDLPTDSLVLSQWTLTGSNPAEHGNWARMLHPYCTHPFSARIIAHIVTNKTDDTIIQIRVSMYDPHVHGTPDGPETVEAQCDFLERIGAFPMGGIVPYLVTSHEYLRNARSKKRIKPEVSLTIFM